jgi:hypothetical protein
MKRARKDLIVTVHSDDEEGEGSGSDDLELEGLDEALDFDGVLGEPEQQQALATVVVPMVTGEEEDEEAAAGPGFSLKEGGEKTLPDVVASLTRSDQEIARVRSRLGLAGVPRDEDTGGADRHLELGDDVAAAEEGEDGLAAPEGFFDRNAHSLRSVDSFHALGLSRALLKTVADCGWTKPSPVQAAVVPVALEGRDMAVSAVTGSGKTGAFALPAIERLLLKPPGSDAAIRVLVLVPTRELAVQCDAVFGDLTRGTMLQRALCVGGTSLKAQVSNSESLSFFFSHFSSPGGAASESARHCDWNAGASGGSAVERARLWA